jgi:hypothetical protein
MCLYDLSVVQEERARARKHEERERQLKIRLENEQENERTYTPFARLHMGSLTIGYLELLTHMCSRFCVVQAVRRRSSGRRRWTSSS